MLVSEKRRKKSEGNREREEERDKRIDEESKWEKKGNQQADKRSRTLYIDT